jgi:hypothetical protein
MPYQFAAGHDNAGGLATVTPQPSCEGIIPGRVSEGLDGNFFEDGFQNCVWSFSCATAEQAEVLYSAFGLTTVRSALCTIRTTVNETGTDEVRDFANFNAVIKKPVIGKEGTYKYWWKNLQFSLTHLGAL